MKGGFAAINITPSPLGAASYPGGFFEGLGHPEKQRNTFHRKALSGNPGGYKE